MILRERQDRILKTLRSGGAASVSELALALRVSQSTIRRDLDLLDGNGELTRTYGGAMACPGQTVIDAGDARTIEQAFEADAGAQTDLKWAMGIKAAAMIKDGSVVLLDIGTSTPFIARELRGRPVTVITSNLAVLDELRYDSTVRLVLLGGVLRRNYRTFVGSLTQHALTQLSADILFLSCTGVRAAGNVVDNMAVEAPIKQSMIEAADSVVLMASAVKFPGTGALRLCSLTDVDVVITTPGANEQTLNICREAGGKVIIA